PTIHSTLPYTPLFRSDDLVANAGARAPHLERDAKRAQRLLEWRAKHCGAAQEDRDVARRKLARRRQQALDLARAEERLVDCVALARHDHGRRRGLDVARLLQPPRRARTLRGREQALACVEHV